MDELLKLWQKTYDEMQSAAPDLRLRIRASVIALHDLEKQLARAEAPYETRLNELESEIRPKAITHAKTYKGDGVTVKYRKGSRRVSYDWKKVDSVNAVLKDILPETAAQLEAARKESVGKPSVSIVREES